MLYNMCTPFAAITEAIRFQNCPIRRMKFVRRYGYKWISQNYTRRVVYVYTSYFR